MNRDYEFIKDYYTQLGKNVDTEIDNAMKTCNTRVRENAILWLANSARQNIKTIEETKDKQAILPIEDKDLISTDTVKKLGLKYDFPKFNSMQTKVLMDGGIFKGENIIVSSPTGSGKTQIAELAIAHCINDWKMAVYLSPTKSLTEEKREEWSKLFPTAKIEIMTGDYGEINRERMDEIGKCDILIMTYEMLASRCTKYKSENNEFLSKIALVVIDEVHMIASKGRGDRLEISLLDFTKINPNAQLILLSATLSDLHRLQEWITFLTGRPTKIIQDNWRPCKLTKHYEEYIGNEWKFDEKYAKLCELIKKYPKDKMIIFCPSRWESEKVADLLQQTGESIEFHNATLAKKDRSNIETQFKTGNLRLISSVI